MKKMKNAKCKYTEAKQERKGMKHKEFVAVLTDFEREKENVAHATVRSDVTNGVFEYEILIAYDLDEGEEGDLDDVYDMLLVIREHFKKYDYFTIFDGKTGIIGEDVGCPYIKILGVAYPFGMSSDDLKDLIKNPSRYMGLRK